MADDSDHEEGEVEEGELPEEPGSAAPAEEAPDASDPAVQAQPQPKPASPAAPSAEQPLSNGTAAVGVASDLGLRREQKEPAKPSGSTDRREEGLQRSRPEPSKHSKEKDLEREREELATDLIKLTAHVSFNDVKNRWVPVCHDLKEAIKKLDKLLRKVKKKKHEEIERYPALVDLSLAVLEGLRNVLLIGASSQGRSVDLEPARALVRAALNYRHDIFAAAQKKELEQLVQENREFRSIWEERNRGKTAAPLADGSNGSVPAGAAAAGAGGPSEDAAAAAQQGPDGAPQPAAAAAAATPPVPPSGSPVGSPPPAPPPDASPSADSSPAAAAQQQPQHQPQQGEAGVAVQRSQLAAGGGGSKIKIVVNTLDAVGGAAAAAAGLKRPIDGDPLQQGVAEQEPAAKRARTSDAPAWQGAEAMDATPAAADTDAVKAEVGAAAPVLLLPEVSAALEVPSELQAAMAKLLQERRLCLVLDLDHTLVNSVKFGEVDPEWEFKLEQMVASQAHLPAEQRDLYRLPRVGMWTKLRPGAREFLRRAAENFELWIHTAGTRSYAAAMVELLDPQGTYFSSRIIAQGINAPPGEDPTPDSQFKRLMQGLEGREPVVVIVDDSSAVWPHDRRNLFVVERYVYFPSSRKRGGMSGRSLLEIDRDECPSRGMLLTAMRVFNAIHQQVFRLLAAPRANPNPLPGPGPMADWDVRAVMAAEKARVLAGVHVVFSRVIPLEADPQQHPLWVLAEQFGATCGVSCVEGTTHVVATHGGTEKVLWAKQRGKHVVSPAWLECSCILWQRASEERFPTPY